MPEPARRRGPVHLYPPAWCWRLVALVALLFCASPDVEAIERRKPQFLKEPAYLVLPFPYELPGIGSGIAFTGLAANIAETNTDAFAILITGDAEGRFLQMEDFHLIEERLQLQVGIFQINKALVNNYQSRGMDSDPDDYTLLEIGRYDAYEVSICLCLWERRIQVGAGVQRFFSRVDRVRDRDGNVIGDFTEPVSSESTTRVLRAMFDYTDDLQDPRKGVRLQASRTYTPPQSGADPDYYVVDASLGVYIPIGRLSTLVFNYFQSDANVIRKGQTDLEALRGTYGLDCDAGDQACLDAEDQLIGRYQAENTFGTATALGGGAFGRLRGYPDGRFRGAHAVFYAAEFRWNLTEEVTPFDYFIWKDVRTNVQLALFAETGSVADLRSELGDTYASSVGLGARLVSGSGFVYRLDVAKGSEGAQTVVIFGYPF